MSGIAVDIFVPFLIDHFFPQTGMNMVKVLEASGVAISRHSNQNSCGREAFVNGFWEEAKAVGERFIQSFSEDGIVVSPSASSVAFVRSYYEHLFYNSGLHLIYMEFKRRFMGVSEFLLSQGLSSQLNPVLEEKAVFHKDCFGGTPDGVGDYPGQLLKSVRGLELVSMESMNEGCGYQGLGPGQLPRVTEKILRGWCHEVMDAGATVVIVVDDLCLFNLRSYVRKQKLPLRVMHLVDVLASGS